MEQSIEIAGTSSSSCYGSKKQKGSENEDQEDRISKLPDSVLIHILSFLPTEDAVKTLIIPRFDNLWTFTPNIDLDSCSHCPRKPHDYSDDLLVDERFVNLVRNVLIRHECSSIFRFCLRFEFYLNPEWDQSVPLDPEQQKIMRRERRFVEEINAWIGYALRREVRVLKLNFLGCGIRMPKYNYILPSCVLTCGSLTKLKLVGCGLNPFVKIHMRSLRSLRLGEIILSEDTIEKILSGCPMLKRLCLYDCYGPSVLSVTSQSLKNLVVVFNETNSSLEISCPYVTSLNISGWIEAVALKNLSCVVDATLDFTKDFNCARGEYLGVRTIFQKLHHVKVFTICDKLILVRLSFLFGLFGCQYNIGK